MGTFNKTMNSKEAEAKIIAAVRSAGLEECADEMEKDDFSFGHPFIELKSGTWADEVTVDIGRQRTGRSNVNDDRTVTYTVKIGWSSTRRTLAMALTAIANYQKAVALAATIEALVEGFPTVIEEGE